jgi:hypothetical protein
MQIRGGMFLAINRDVQLLQALIHIALVRAFAMQVLP